MAQGFLFKAMTRAGLTNRNPAVYTPGKGFTPFKFVTPIATPTATLQFRRLSLTRQAALNQFAAGSIAQQQILRKAVLKSGGFTKIFIKRPPVPLKSTATSLGTSSTPERFQALHLYKLAFSQPINFPNFSPRTISALGGRYLVWGISTSGDYNVFVYVLSESSGTTSRGAASLKKSQTAGVTIIIVGILAVLSLGLSIVLFKNVKEVIGAGGLGITFALAIGLGGFFLFKKIA